MNANTNSFGHCVEMIPRALKASGTSTSTLAGALSGAPQNAFKSISRNCVPAGNLRALKLRLVALSSGSRVAFSTCLKARF